MRIAMETILNPQVLYTTAQLREKFEEFLAEQKSSGSPRELYEPMEYILSLGGKRLRPVLLLMAANLFSDEIEKALKPAVGLELFHNFTLIHDDIMDEAPLRRGSPSVHEKFGVNTALLSGDIMFVKAGTYMFLDGDKASVELHKVFNEMAIAVCEGQQMDMNFETRNDVNLDQYLEMIGLKTAALFGCCMKMGGLAVGTENRDVEAIQEFGFQMGMAFQLMDDLLDSFGSPEKFGKKVGGDIIQNKKTYLLLRSLELADGSTLDELNQWLSTSEDSPEKVEAVIGIYEKLNVREKAVNAMTEFHQAALAKLHEIGVPENRKEPLKQFAEQLLLRQL